MKHFAGYGAAEGGRDYDAAYLAETQLQNVYLPPFKAAVEAGVGSVMTAYMDLNDVPATGNGYLLRQLLRKEWGFKGFVISDGEAVGHMVTQGFARNPQDAALRAFTAGVNMDLAGGTYSSELPKLVAQRKISVQQIDDAVRPVLEAKIRLGLFEDPYVDEVAAAAAQITPDHRRAARTAAQRSAVLLRNENGVLPLRRDLTSVALIGPFVDSGAEMQGPWAPAAKSAEAIAVLEGIRSKLPAATRVGYAEGVQIRKGRKWPSDDFMYGKCPPVWSEETSTQEFLKAVELARRSELTIMILGETREMIGEYTSRASLDLPGRQQELLEAVMNTGKPVVLVLVNGRPLNISWAAEHVPAILEAWYPGSEGGNAIADLLFGDANPGGKLPFTWPRSVGQVPISYAHNLTQLPETASDFQSRYWDLESSPLYPFGYGLSYTQFKISNLRLDESRIKPGESLSVSVDVENTARRTGDEVVQLYIHQRAGSNSRPIRQLRGFQRIALKSAEKRTLHFSLGEAELSYWSSQHRAWVQEPESFDAWVGNDSTAGVHATFQVVSNPR